MGLKSVIVEVIGMLVLVQCAQGHCRHPVNPPGDAKPVDAPDSSASTKSSAEDHIMVYKYDGSLQCKMGKSVSLESMAKELEGIPIYSSSKKRDGLMHIQVCGSISGLANVYEIPQSFQKQAEGKGFKKWSFE